MANGHGTRRDKAPGSKDLTKDGTPRPPSNMTRHEAADYIAGMLDGLHSIANAADLPFIAYLLAVAREEAQAEKARED